VEVLQELSVTLKQFGYTTDIDNSAENLSLFTLDRRDHGTEAPSTSRQQKGFLERRPEHLVAEADKLYMQVRDLAKSIAKNSFEKPTTRKRKRGEGRLQQSNHG
jgi:chromosome condensin MukBEF ATPase and DNA-binding subunit MukB